MKKKVNIYETALRQLSSLKNSEFYGAIADEERERDRRERAIANVDADIRHYERQRAIHEDLLKKAIAENDMATQFRCRKILDGNRQRLDKCYEIKAEKDKKVNDLALSAKENQR